MVYVGFYKKLPIFDDPGNRVLMKERLRDRLKHYPNVKRRAKRLLAILPLSMRLGKEFWAWYAFFEESERWSTDQIVSYQMDRLRALLMELTQRSPFYQQRLSGVDIRGLETLEQFQAQVGSLSRSEFREHYADMRSLISGKQRLAKVQTSGTTGMALQFHHHLKDNAREWAAICHQWKRVGYLPGKSRRAEFRGLTASGELVEVFPHENMIRCSIMNLKTQHVRHYAEQIRKHDIDFYHGYPSAFYLLAKEIKNSSIDFPEPKAILMASEMVYDWQLLQIQEAFPNAKLFSHYGCAERTVLAAWCEHRREYHVLPQYSLVEVDPITKEIIGTNLFNSVNGFVRYHMTDTVLDVKYEPCPDCNRPYTPRLIKLGGRSEDYLYSPQNGWVPPAILTYPFKALGAIQETQLLQREENQVVVHYSLQPEADASMVKSDLEHIRAGMHRLFGEEMRFHFEQVERFQRGPTGKFTWVICDLEEVPRGSEY